MQMCPFFTYETARYNKGTPLYPYFLAQGKELPHQLFQHLILIEDNDKTHFQDLPMMETSMHSL